MAKPAWAAAAAACSMATWFESTVHQRARMKAGSSDLGVSSRACWRNRSATDFGNLLDEIVFGGDAFAIMNGCGIGHGRAGGERVGRIVGHIGDENRNLLRGISGLGEASSFDGGEMFADGVDLGDGRSGMDEGAIGGGQVGLEKFRRHSKVRRAKTKPAFLRWMSRRRRS